MRRRIIICLIFLLAWYSLGDVIAWLCLGETTRQLTRLAESHRIQSMRADLAAGGARFESALLASLAGREEDVAQHEETVQQFRRSLERCTSCHHTAASQAELDQIQGVFDAYQKAARQLASESGTKKAEIHEREALQRAHELAVRISKVSELARRHLDVRETEAATSVRNAWFVLSGTFIVALAAGGIVALHLKGRLTGPVETLLEGIERVRQGDLGHRIHVHGDDEFRMLATALNRAHESLKSARDGIIQAEKMAAVGTLAAGVAHEVNNPLASISSVVQMMRRRCHTAEEAEQIDLILRHIARISRVSRELLTFSRPTNVEEQTRVEVGALLQQAKSLLRYDKRVQRVRISSPRDVGSISVHGNADQLLLVFTNVIVNALDALSAQSGDDGHLTITVGQHGDRIAVRFEDNGPGMNEEQVNNAFEPFFTTKEPGAGTGLGLWACYQVIEKHNGTIRIDSRLGEGTAIVVELPRMPSSQHAAPLGRR